ncbi:hypothetical protein L873DRAFT_1908232 [Choiromyces venosus 120613-1]|uniref:PiggyBac transposable element-derived protein domain-containing protein n=1 Tax=Choiromyces venosus 120613-1 TaxID=1336337 RepID=A0A3N4IS97_9PEZI|nr:hypothetical protein L873DRAFT_1908232 [Choiromyces venosus 120613-1]
MIFLIYFQNEMPTRKQDNATKDGQCSKIENLPEPPEFDYLKSPFPEHEGFPTFPADFPTNPTPSQIFGLFFDDKILDTIVSNTNAYVEEKLPLLRSKQEFSFVQSWVPLKAPELRIFIAIQIYMGIVKCPNIEMYWEPELKYAPFRCMSLVHFQQIK